MPGTFFGINTALRGLQVNQRAQETASHNVANASTPGFSRQQVIMVPTAAYPIPAMSRPGGQGWQIGSGVDAQEIRRLRDRFLDGQIRREDQSLGAWESRSNALQEIEVVFAEPSDTGLNTIMSQFWSAWQELSKYAESAPVRTTVVETSVALAEALRHTDQQLETIRENLNQVMEIKVQEVNTFARQIADLNKQIVTIKAASDQPNDLMDQRDKLLGELAAVVDFTVTELADGSVQVMLDGQNLVQVDPAGALVRTLKSSRDGNNNTVITWQDNSAVTIRNGELKGLQAVRDDQLLVFADNLDTLANGLRDRVNAIHQAGRDLSGNAGLAFFSGNNGAADIDVNAAIRANVTLVAAATTGTAGAPSPGDGSNALAIAQLQNQALAEVGGTLILSVSGVTFDDYYKDFTARLGVAAHEAGRMVDNQKALVEQLTNRRDSISGVSIDEEMANMIQFQHGYNAAARALTVLDEMLEVIINRMAV